MLDTLLLEPYPVDVWIALRTDGAFGSGTQSDPYDGSTETTFPLAITSLTRNGLEAVAVTSTPHDYVNDDVVTISGVTGGGAACWNGTFLIYGVSGAGSTSFKYKLRMSPGESAGGSPLATKWIYRLDQVLREQVPTQVSRIWVSDLTKSGCVAQVVTSENHGFANGDIVTIAGVTGNGADCWNGTFATYDVTDQTHFKYLMKAEPSAAAAGFPVGALKWGYWSGQPLRNRFPHTRVHLGPGVFETRGCRPVVNASGGAQGQWENGIGPQPKTGWFPNTGQKIQGAGMGLTTLKLVGGDDMEHQAIAVSLWLYEFLEHVELSDFTVDCNIDGQLHSQMACAAVYLVGRHLRLRRVRAINFGSHTPDYRENFVFTLAAPHPNTWGYWGVANAEGADLVIEDCIAEQPSPNCVNNSTIFGLGGASRPSDGALSYARACAIRNCVVNGQYVYGPQVGIASVASQQVGQEWIITLTTKTPHQRTVPGNVVVRGVAVANSFANPVNGVFAIHQVVNSTQLTYKVTTNPGITTNPNNVDLDNATTGGGVSSHPVTIESITQVSGNLYKVKTLGPHFRTTNNNVVIQGVRFWQGTNRVTSKVFNGNFAVDAYDPAHPDELFYSLGDTPEGQPVQNDSAIIGMLHQALTTGAAWATVVEGNRIFHCGTGGPYQDTGSNRELIVRNNYYHDVFVGPRQDLAGINGGIDYTNTPIPLDQLRHEGATAIATCQNPHGFRVNDLVTIVDVTGDDADLYNGTFPIAPEGSATEFRYSMPGTPEGDPTPPGKYLTRDVIHGIYSQRRLVSLTKSDQGPPYTATAKSWFNGHYYDDHGLLPGDVVLISFAGPYDQSQGFTHPDSCNGLFKVTALGPTDVKTEFQFVLIDEPAGAWGTGFSPGYFGRMWQVRRLLVENNVFELPVRRMNGAAGAYWGAVCGVSLYGGQPDRQRRFPQVVVRGNVIRHYDGLVDSGKNTGAIDVWSGDDTLLEGNVVDLETDDPIYCRFSATVSTFRNSKPSGALILPYTPYDQHLVGEPELYSDREVELRRQFEEAALMSLFG